MQKNNCTLGSGGISDHLPDKDRWVSLSNFLVQTAGAYLGFFSMKHALEYWYSPLDGMLVVHRRVTPSSMMLVPIYTPSERGTKWSNVPCLKKTTRQARLEP